MRFVVLAFLAVVVGGCQTARQVVPIELEPAALVAPSDPRLLTSHATAVRGIAAMLARDFGLPVPERVTVFLYGSRQVFEDGLIHDARLSPARASELSEFAIGVGRRRQLLFRDDATGRGREWLRLVAHELAHVCQIELSRGERGPAQWMKEGMAEWVAFAILERLGLDSLELQRARALDVVRRSTPPAARFDLEALASPAGFTAQHRRAGTVLTYQLAFLMVSRLIERHGFAAVVAYFRAFVESDDRHGNFRRVFGQTLADFEHEFSTDLAAQRQ